jgi:hypothetical protein
MLEVENAIKVCRNHLDRSQARGTEIEAYLTRYLLVLIYGAYERRFRQVVVDRAKRTNDAVLVSFVENTIVNYHGLKLSDIRGKLLARFSDKHVKDFDAMIKDTEGAVRYDTIISNRHSTAHGQIVNLTFDELVGCYEKAESVIASFSKVVNS